MKPLRDLIIWIESEETMEDPYKIILTIEEEESFERGLLDKERRASEGLDNNYDMSHIPICYQVNIVSDFANYTRVLENNYNKYGERLQRITIE